MLYVFHILRFLAGKIFLNLARFKNLYQALKEVYLVSEVTAPMGGKIIDIKVNVGDAVNENDEVVIIEAMKMELPVVATASGTVKEIKCNNGDAVEADAVLIVLE